MAYFIVFCFGAVFSFIVRVVCAHTYRAIKNRKASDYCDGDAIIVNASVCLVEHLDDRLKTKELKAKSESIARERSWKYIQRKIDTAVKADWDVVYIDYAELNGLSVKEIKNVLRRNGYKTKVVHDYDGWLGDHRCRFEVELGGN